MARKPEKLATRLMRRLVLIAAAVLIANIAFVALYDAADREALLAEVVDREIAALDRIVLATPQSPPMLRIGVRSHFGDYPDAYGFILANAQGEILDSMNPGLFPPELMGSAIIAGDWVARKTAADRLEAYASHVVTRPDGDFRVYFAIVADPANLIRAEIWDEFLGHVWLPLLPTVVLLIGGALLILRKDLGPLGDAAAWARAIQPGVTFGPFQDEGLPAEMQDLTQAVNRAVARLGRELTGEKRRAAEAAHALRTPVAVLVARLGNLPDDPALEPLRQDVKTLSRTITQFLLSSGADRMEILPGDRIELTAVAEQTVRSLTPFVILSGSQIAFTPGSTDQWVRGNAEGIELALTNLIENAVFHGGIGTIEVTVGPGPVVSVSDTGAGLSDTEKSDMFKPFWRGSEAPKGGAGLGLAIVERIQRAHGGAVDAKDRPEGGAIFSLTYQSV